MSEEIARFSVGIVGNEVDGWRVVMDVLHSTRVSRHLASEQHPCDDIACSGWRGWKDSEPVSHEMPCDDCGTSIPILFARIVGARPVRLVCRICAQRWLEGRRFKGLA